LSYQTDNGGFAFKCNDIKLHTSGSTWAMKLSQLNRFGGTVRIITYSLPDMEYVKAQFNRRPRDIFLIAHRKFLRRAQSIKATFPDIRIAVNDEVHSKVLLIAPHTIYISSANFGLSKWHESFIGLHSQDAHDWYWQHEFEPLWASSSEIESRGCGSLTA